MGQGKVVAIANQKGGVGKTTTAVNIGAALARFLGWRVLIVDFDPQCNATSSLGASPALAQPNAYALISGQCDPTAAILSTGVPGLYLVPSSPDLAGAEVELATVEERERVLARSLAPLAGSFDVTLVDCPPSLGLLTLNALVAAQHGVLIPVQCEYLPLEGLTRLVATIASVRRLYNPSLTIVGILMTMYDARTRLSAEVVEEVRRHFPKLVFEAVIPRSVRLSEAPSRGCDVYAHAPSSAGSESYLAAAREFAARLGMMPS
jgi:chromosome partitioning protein